ncbi:hypothetical protein Hanom_Chr10g00903831 [Helianthus anomalus]
MACLGVRWDGMPRTSMCWEGMPRPRQGQGKHIKKNSFGSHLGIDCFFFFFFFFFEITKSHINYSHIHEHRGFNNQNAREAFQRYFYINILSRTKYLVLDSRRTFVLTILWP